MPFKYHPLHISASYLKWSNSLSLDPFFNRLPIVPAPHRIVGYAKISPEMKTITNGCQVHDMRQELHNVSESWVYMWDRLAWFSLGEGERYRFEIWDCQFSDIGRLPKYRAVEIKGLRWFSHKFARTNIIQLSVDGYETICHMTEGETTDAMFEDWATSYNERFSGIYGCEVIKL